MKDFATKFCNKPQQKTSHFLRRAIEGDNHWTVRALWFIEKFMAHKGFDVKIVISML